MADRERKSKKLVACPICGEEYGMFKINAHVETCLASSEEEKEPIVTGDNDSRDESFDPPAKKRHRADSSSSSSASPSCKSSSERAKRKQSPIRSTRRRSAREESKTNLFQKAAAWGSLGNPKTQSKPSTRRTESTGPVVASQTNISTESPKPLFAPKSINFKIKQEVSNSNHDGKKPTEGQSIFAIMGQNARGNAEKKSADFAPLAEKMRPSSLDDYVGQDKVIGTNTMLRSLIEANDVPSMILWGPPGCGKTTLARIVASNAKKNSNSRLRFVQLSATTSNVSEVREVIKIAQNEQTMFKRKTILFIDEIHRFNKLQQDTFLMHIENGTITLIGATTQNPSFQVNSALLSRCKVVVLEKLSIQSMENILTKAIKSLHGCILEEKEEPATAIEKYHHAERPELFVERNALSMLCNLCDGDGRAALNCLEIAVHSQVASHRSGGLDKMNSDYVVVKLDHIKEGLQRSHILYDKMGEEHYNCISAMQKSIRGSDANASLYWVTRMLLGGEDPLYIARRLVRTASEDIGLADPHAVGIAVSAYQACQSLGMPECDVVLAQCAIYLARAPKSTEVYSALTLAKSSIQEHNGPLPCVPLHLRNAPNITMRNLGYGKGYNPRRAMVFMPQGMQGVNFFS